MSDHSDSEPRNGADALLATLTQNGVEVCFTNPGTSEMHFVAALDQQDQMRSILGLFEGVVTGAADCLLYTSPSPRDKRQSRMPSSA